ncbi:MULTISPECIES: c-type cytochrome [Chryseobacterium]|uniref:Cytochrome C n=1 Tax=Chryseobacterium rhizosphaerae TaxID=395937 RepID=A0AAE3Y995_9FLAO|nr:MULTISPECIES: c-type cytochrome [Chryseobacterium]MBL3546180.1 c-type cytochrome [Chryseobacterium sp. KMC2]MDC8100934.1 c-type cytochrome [Chryseobacterium rhizosphaerae]MDR6525966.1 cytochrome c [Chryseobacterium rhizosphaerae]MDR6544844.1 cytochrome c [Chryseobacterium rhizosphaerae]REC77364.1 cytochrome C [Chryseobacterium rhizosphaerae]
MKKIFLAGALGFLAFSCSKKENTADVAASSETAVVSEPAKSNLSGDQIIETLDCSGCHSVSERMIGPSYQEIAGKYSEKDMEMLASKIIEGGSGVWGGVPMAAHPQVSKEDAKKMVEYILSQKK